MYTRSKWVVLGLGTTAQTSGTIYLYGLPFLLPALRESTGMTLPQLGLLLALPVDRHGRGHVGLGRHRGQTR
jgi:hypothetical protein